MAKLKPRFQDLGFEVFAGKLGAGNSVIPSSPVEKLCPEEIDTVIKTWSL